MLVCKRNFCFWLFFGFLWGLIAPIMCFADGDDGGGAGDPNGGGGDGDPNGGGDDSGDAAADGEDGADKGASDTVSRKELERVIKARDKAKKQLKDTKRQLAEVKSEAEKIKDLERQLAEYKKTGSPEDDDSAGDDSDKGDSALPGKPDDAVATAQAAKVVKLAKENKKLQKQLQQVTDSTAKELETATTELATVKKHLADLELSKSISEAAQKHGAASPEQIVRMLRGDFVQDPDEGEFVASYDAGNGVEELSVGDYVELFLQDKQNANLLSSKARKGRDAPEDSDSGGGKKSQAPKKLTPAQKRQANLRGMSEKEYYETVVVPNEEGARKAAERRRSTQEQYSGFIPGQIKL